VTQIKRTYDGVVLFSHDSESVAETLKAAIAKGVDLRGVDLRGANLRGANLRDANLRDANLRGVDLRGAQLRYANLRGANLRDANLRDANLRDANLRGAQLRYANLQGADLQGVDLRFANLQSVDLQGAHLRYANLQSGDLQGAHLRGANLRGAKALETFCIVAEGVLIGYKKLANGEIAVLRIPAKAKRLNAYGSRKCRAEYAVVISGSGASQHDSAFAYETGKKIVPDSFDPDPRIECSHGVHFFITRAEAEAY
jgi:Family of unknown function (DUF5758)/Pentapeptide repeats (8 copies)